MPEGEESKKESSDISGDNQSRTIIIVETKLCLSYTTIVVIAIVALVVLVRK